MKRLLAMALACVAGCGTSGDPWDGTGKKRVVVTIPPLAAFVHEVGGDHVAVQVLCEKEGPHGYEADPRSLAAFKRNDLFFSVGLGLDDKITRKLLGQARRKEADPVKLGNGLPEKVLLDMEHDHDHDHGHEGHHHHGDKDPHVWLGVPEAVLMVNQIRDVLSRIDEEHADDYKANAAAYVKKLEKLQADGKAMFKKGKKFIAFHDSFKYFARSFGLEQVDAMEIGGDTPSASQLAKIVEKCKKENVGVITVEPQFAKGSAKTVEKELAAQKKDLKLVEVDPLETGDGKEVAKEKGAWYISRMEKNLKAMAGALP